MSESATVNCNQQGMCPAQTNPVQYGHFCCSETGIILQLSQFQQDLSECSNNIHFWNLTVDVFGRSFNYHYTKSVLCS